MVCCQKHDSSLSIFISLTLNPAHFPHLFLSALLVNKQFCFFACGWHFSPATATLAACSYVIRKSVYWATTMVWWEPVCHSSCSEQGWLRVALLPASSPWLRESQAGIQVRAPRLNTKSMLSLKLCLLGILPSSSQWKWVELALSHLPFLSEMTNRS